MPQGIKQTRVNPLKGVKMGLFGFIKDVILLPVDVALDVTLRIVLIPFA